MYRSICQVFFLAALCLFASCSYNTVKVVSYTPNGEVPGQTSFTFEFNKDLAPMDSIGKWSDTRYIDFSPAISGKFKWIDPSTLLFSPEGPLAPSQEYKAEVSRKVMFNSDYKAGFSTLRFHTPYFEVNSVDFFWTQVPRAEFKLSVQANVKFDYPVDPAVLARHMEVYRDGQRIEGFEIVTKEAASVMAINFGEMPQTDKEQEFKVVFKKGLNSIYNKESLPKDKDFSVKLPPISQLEVQHISTGMENEQAWIEVGTSQMVDQQSLEKYVHLSPQSELSFIVNPSNFRIYGSFKPSDVVELTIDKGLPGMYGGALAQAFSKEVLLENLDPMVQFQDKKEHYLMLSGYKNLGIQAVNVPAVEVEVYEVFKNNLVHYLNNQYYTSYDSEDSYPYYSEYYYDDYSGNLDQYGSLLFEKTLKAKESPNQLQDFTLNLDEAVKQKRKGIYVVKVSSSMDRWRQDKKFIAISDLAIIAKRSNNDLMVWVNSIATAEPAGGVNVKLYSSNNQVLLEGKTNGSGMVTFSNINEEIAGFEPRLLMAEKDEDFNYIDLRETLNETSRFDVGGKAESPTGFDAYIYAERNLYRPGEDMHFSAILRTLEMKTVAGMPVLVNLVAPSGKTIQEWKKNTNEEGSFELTFSIPAYATTGQYTAEVRAGSGEVINTYTFSVEEFAPDKIKVELNREEGVLKPGDILKLDISSRYLFGAPAAKHNYDLDISFSHQNFVSKKFSGYDFSNTTFTNSFQDNYTQQGELDATGIAHIQYKIPAELNGGGLIKANALVSVFDVTGRSVSRGESYLIAPRNYFIGIASKGYYLSTQEASQIKIAAVDANDNPLNGFKAQAELIRYEWNTVLQRVGERYMYRSEKKEVSEWQRSITLNGTADLDLKPTTSGSYELRVRKTGESQYTLYKFYAYGYSTNSATSFQVNKEGNVEIVPDKAVYAPGEKAKLLFMCPFSGRMLVTLERNKVYTYKYIEVRNNHAELVLPIDEGYMPNVYVSATLFKKHNATRETPFLVGHGWANLKVEKPGNRIDVKIEAPEKVRPNTVQEVVIKTIPQRDVFVTLAAVDEGILQIKNYRTPAPYPYMYFKKQLSVQSYDLYKFLLPELAGSSKTGGDAAFEMNRKRSLPLTAQRFKLLSFWSGIRRSDAKGVVRVKLNLPQFNGDVRLMAVAYTGAKFGSAEGHMQVADDVILMPAIPRFLSQNDNLQVPVILMNTTDKAGPVTVKMKLEGPMEGTSTLEQTINLKAKGEEPVNFSLKTGTAIGVGRITFETSGLAVIKDETEIAVRPVSPLIKEDGAGVLAGGKSMEVPISGGYYAPSVQSTFTVSRFPALEHADQLRYLLGYPHGCAEQTVAKAFPQLYFEDLSAAVSPQMFKSRSSTYYVNEAIRKLQGMQLYDGSISYWPGGNYHNWWACTFAAHFLLEAQKAGYVVNTAKLNDLLDFLHKKAAEKGEYSYRVWETPNRSVVTKVAEKEIIYSLYVLALAKKGDMALMNYYRARPNLVSQDMKYLLAGAYALMNNWQMYNNLLPKEFVPEMADRHTGYDFDSDIRANAIMLNVLLEVDPSNGQVASMVKYLAKNTRRAMNTQDQCWTFMSLGKAARQTAKGDMTVTLTADGKTLGTYSSSDKFLTVNSKELTGKNVTLSAKGEGNVYYYWQTEGIKLNAPVKEEDRNLTVRRMYYDRFGKKLNDVVAQGQIVVCRISVETFRRAAENVAVTDMIPAGFEIMNPRITATNQLSWLPAKRMNPDYVDIRDDRLLIFTSIGSGLRQEYYYMLRAINQGDFNLPPLGAEAMYDPEMHSYNGAKRIRVVKGDMKTL